MATTKKSIINKVIATETSNQLRSTKESLTAEGTMLQLILTFSLFLIPLFADSNLDNYLTRHSRSHNCVGGQVTPPQREYFSRTLERHPEIRTISQLRLDAGPFTEFFFQKCKGLEKFLTFDINNGSNARATANYLSRKYGKVFHFMDGDSKSTVLQYVSQFPSDKFDLIYIDASNSNQSFLQDILNCKMIAHENTFLWVDGYEHDHIKQAIHECQRNNIIVIDRIIRKDDHTWAEAHYL